MASSTERVVKRSVGRPRQFDDDVERRLLLDAAYTALRDDGLEFTIANILTTAGVSTRSFYRHFDSKNALLQAMYRRDGQWAAERLTKRLTDATSAREAVEWWIDEIFSLTRSPRRAERVAVLGSITGLRAGTEQVAAEGRDLLIDPLRSVVAAGCADGSFSASDPATAAELVAAVALHAAGLAEPSQHVDQTEATSFCLRALGAQT